MGNPAASFGKTAYCGLCTGMERSAIAMKCVPANPVDYLMVGAPVRLAS
jgi:hypothetical protein